MSRTTWAALLALALAASGCALRPGGPDQEALAVPIKVRIRITPYSRVADIAALRTAALGVAHVTAVNVLEFGQVADDQTDGTLPVYELQCAARTPEVSLPRLYEAIDRSGYEVTDVLVQVRVEDDAYTILIDSLSDYARTRAIALSADWLPVKAAEGMPEVRSLSRMGDRALELVVVKLATSHPAASDETMFLYAYILERASHAKAIGPLRGFLQRALAEKAAGSREWAKYSRSLDMAALALQRLTGHPKIDYLSWVREREQHYASILAAADSRINALPAVKVPEKAKPGRTPPSLR